MNQTEKKPITKQDRLSICTFGECQTVLGQLIEFRCHPDEKDMVKAFIQQYVRQIEIPTNKEHNMSHGGYGRYTRFNITQHKYAGGGSGYIEMLEIHDPPDGRWPFVCLEHNGHYRPGDWFWEFKDLESMLAVWDQWWQRSRCEPLTKTEKMYDVERELVRPMKNVKRTVECGFLTPWFYAMGDQIICGDFVIPDEGLFSHPTYTPGRQFVIQHLEDPPMIKTCMCCYKFKKQVWERGGGGYYDNRETTKEVYCVVWKDGTQTEIGDGLWTVRPAELGELWITVALEKFQRVIAGDLAAFEIPFIDGSKFVGRFRAGKQDLTLPGKYMVKAYFIKKDETKEHLRKGVVEFEPSEKAKDVIALIRQQAWDKDYTLSRIESVVYMREKGWRGFFEKRNRKSEDQVEG